MEITINDIKVGDVISVQGSKVRVTEVWEDGVNYWGEKVIHFKVSPFDQDAVRMLGRYSTATFGGWHGLRVHLYERSA